MEHVKLDVNDKDKYSELLIKTASVLKSGHVIVYPTDTLYGIGANAYDENAILKVFDLKKQSRNKPISVLVKNIKMARRIACIDSRVERILENIWPGPVTVILRKKDSIPYMLTANGETIGVRVPDLKLISDLMKNIDFPLTATSANISGRPDLIEPEDIIKTFQTKDAEPALFIDSGKIHNPEPSTIVDLTTNSPKIVRIGIADKTKMLDIINKFL